ncbi:MAG: HAD family hydrolase [Acidimicrobiales bacterium]
MTAPPPVTTVVFDLGGVLIDWRREFLYDQLIADPDRRAWFLDTVCTLEWNADGDRGRPFAELIDERSALFPDETDLIAAYWDRWDEMSGPPIHATVSVLEQVQQLGVPTFALTNWSAETLPRVRHRYPFLDSFDGMLMSGEEGIIKPDPAIYRLMCERFDLAPDRTFFVDDNAANIDAARALGLVSHRFVDATALRAALIEAGVSVAPHPRSA